MFLDIGVGILMATWVSKMFALSLRWEFVLLGIGFSLLMDADFLLHLGRGGSTHNAYKHRDLLHVPFMYIPAGMILLSFFSLPVAVLFGLCSLGHFIHDSIGIGWGVQWLAPFNTDHFTFFYSYRPKNKEALPRKLFYRWKHADVPAVEAKYGDPEWVTNVYRKWHPFAVVEFLVFVTALIVLYFIT